MVINCDFYNITAQKKNKVVENMVAVAVENMIAVAVKNIFFLENVLK